MRQLTTRFLSYTIDQYEKKNNCVLMDALDIGNLAVSKILDLIQLGNGPDCPREKAATRLDEYLYSDEEHSTISAYLDVLDEMDKDLKILKSCGIKIADLKASFESEVKTKTATIVANIKEAEEETDNVTKFPGVKEETCTLVEGIPDSEILIRD